MKSLIQSIIALAFIGVAGCASTPAPETPREVLAAVEVTFVGAATTASTLYDHGVISQAELREVAATLSAISVVLDDANAVITSLDPEQSELDRVLTALQAVRQTLSSISLQLKTAQQERIPNQ